MIERILVPVDGSRHANRAVETAAGVAQKFGASVYLLHVIRNLSLPREILSMIASGEVTASRMEILEDSAEIILSNAREKLEEESVTVEQHAYVVGDPAIKIVEFSDQHEIDLIVLGHRGLNPEGGLLGSVTQKVLGLTDSPCLVIT
jgi:nucleotide-binding universal stress UspA family protein